MTGISLATFSTPEISCAGTAMGAVYATAFAVDKASGLLDKINPMNLLVKYFDNITADNVEVLKENQAEIDQLDREIATLQAMKKNQQPQK